MNLFFLQAQNISKRWHPFLFASSKNMDGMFCELIEIQKTRGYEKQKHCWKAKRFRKMYTTDFGCQNSIWSTLDENILCVRLWIWCFDKRNVNLKTLFTELWFWNFIPLTWIWNFYGQDFDLKYLYARLHIWKFHL